MKLSKINKGILTFALCLLTMAPQSIFAEEKNEKPHDFSYTINEYEMLKKSYDEIISNPNAGLSMYNESPDKLEFILNYEKEYKTNIKNLQKEDVNTLKAWDYSDEQIEAIKNFDGSEKAMSRASAKCKVYGGFTKFTHNSSSSAAEMVAAFNWQGRPIGFFNDIFAVTWTAPYQSKVSQCKASLEYYTTDIKKWRNKSVNLTPKASGLYNNHISFPKYRSFVSGIPNTHFINKGSFIMTMSCKGNHPNLGGYTAYGYTTLNISPSVSYPASLSISFSTGVKTMGTARFYA